MKIHKERKMNKQNATQSEQVIVSGFQTKKEAILISHLRVWLSWVKWNVEKVKFYKNKLTQGFLRDLPTRKTIFEN